VAFGSELGGESTASEYVRVCEWGLALGAYERRAICFLHLWMCTPHATSTESLLVRKGAVDYACIVWSEPLVLVSLRIFPYIVL
jgi:hypothetical protein